jgi:hypothetical protein
MGSGSTLAIKKSKSMDITRKPNPEYTKPEFDIAKIKNIDSYVGTRKFSMELLKKKGCTNKSYKSEGEQLKLIRASSSILANTPDSPELSLAKATSQMH